MFLANWFFELYFTLAVVNASIRVHSRLFDSDSRPRRAAALRLSLGQLAQGSQRASQSGCFTGS
jgi:hypothetical protein